MGNLTYSHSKKTLVALASIMGIRMLGLFMILPVFSAAAIRFPNATPELVGLTLGIYGLTQAFFQLPLGMLSDHIGRKPVIFFGLLLLLIGSVIAARTHSIHILLFGRALQGAGAIGSTVLAFAADLTKESSRGKAMALMGLVIGFAFTLAMVLGPILNGLFQLSGIFWITALLSVFAIILLTVVIPAAPAVPKISDHTILQCLKITLSNKKLLALNFGIASLHAILTAMFLVLPIILSHRIKINMWHQVSLYLSVLFFSFIFALPLITISEKKNLTKIITAGAIITIIISEFLFCLYHHRFVEIALLLFVFFIAFTFLEATLPSLTSKIAPAHLKGTAMGVYSSCQFFGIFVGGAAGGYLLSKTNFVGVFLFAACMGLIWLAVILMGNTGLRKQIRPGSLPSLFVEK